MPHGGPQNKSGCTFLFYERHAIQVEHGRTRGGYCYICTRIDTLCLICMSFKLQTSLRQVHTPTNLILKTKGISLFPLFFFWEKNSMPWEILNYLPNILDILVLMFGNGITRLFVTSDKKIKRLYFITFS